MTRKTSAQIESDLASLATRFPTICKRKKLSSNSHGGKQIHFVRIGVDATKPRPAVIIIAGVHAREWAPPDAVLSFITKLMEKYNSGRPKSISYPSIKVTYSTVGEVKFPGFVLSASSVKKFIEQAHLFVLPMVNPDGRDFSLQTAPAGPRQAQHQQVFDFWRKNRASGTCSPLVTGIADTAHNGVDINRNFNIAWDFTDYYHPGALTDVRKRVTDQRCELVFHGTGAASEPETKNVQELIDKVIAGHADVFLTKKPKVVFFMDVHSAARLFFHAWAMEERGSDPTKTYRNTAWDMKRDNVGVTGQPTYQEYMPNSKPFPLFALHRSGVGGTLQWYIRAKCGGKKNAANKKTRKRSSYSITDSFNPLKGGYTGISRDYAFSRQFEVTASPTIISYTMESGHKEDGGFHPSLTNFYPKVEREIHVGLWTFIRQAQTRTW